MVGWDQHPGARVLQDAWVGKRPPQGVPCAFCLSAGHYRMIPDDWRHVSLSAQELVKEMLKLDATGSCSTPCRAPVRFAAATGLSLWRSWLQETDLYSAQPGTASAQDGLVVADMTSARCNKALVVAGSAWPTLQAYQHGCAVHCTWLLHCPGGPAQEHEHSSMAAARCTCFAYDTAHRPHNLPLFVWCGCCAMQRGLLLSSC